jgi:hypothetical protein
MRRWVCVFALLVGFAGDGYAWTVRPRLPVAIVRPLEPTSSGPTPTVSRHAFPLTGSWWQIA